MGSGSRLSDRHTQVGLPSMLTLKKQTSALSVVQKSCPLKASLEPFIDHCSPFACRKPSHADLNFMKDLMQQIEENGIPAASPIEQRWTASSSSPMSPAAARGQPETVHSWVGIIMYLPTEEEAQRKAITDR